MNRQKILEPSLLAADPGRLAEQLEQAERGGAKMWHLDVMDGRFVRNLSFGPHFCAGLRKYTGLPIDVHLMVARPSRILDLFLNAGASSVVLHTEIRDAYSEPVSQMLREIKAAGAVPAISLNPKTPLTELEDFLHLADRVLLMSVEPGYGGQTLLPGSIERLRELRAMLDRVSPAIELQLDGGVTLENAGEAIGAGADILIAGSAVFEAPDIAARCREFTGLFS